MTTAKTQSVHTDTHASQQQIQSFEYDCIWKRKEKKDAHTKKVIVAANRACVSVASENQQQFSNR